MQKLKDAIALLREAVMEREAALSFAADAWDAEKRADYGDFTAQLGAAADELNDLLKEAEQDDVE